MPVSLFDTGPGLGARLVFAVTGSTSSAAAGVGNVANPTGRTMLVRRAELVTKAPSTGAANLSIGITTSGEAATDILNAAAANGLSPNHVYNCFASQNTAGTAISAPQLWTPEKFLTFTGSASTAGYSGYLYLEVIYLD